MKSSAVLVQYPPPWSCRKVSYTRISIASRRGIYIAETGNMGQPRPVIEICKKLNWNSHRLTVFVDHLPMYIMAVPANRHCKRNDNNVDGLMFLESHKMIRTMVVYILTFDVTVSSTSDGTPIAISLDHINSPYLTEELRTNEWLTRGSHHHMKGAGY